MQEEKSIFIFGAYFLPLNFRFREGENRGFVGVWERRRRSHRTIFLPPPPPSLLCTANTVWFEWGHWHSRKNRTKCSYSPFTINVILIGPPFLSFFSRYAYFPFYGERVVYEPFASLTRRKEEGSVRLCGKVPHKLWSKLSLSPAQKTRERSTPIEQMGN